MKQPIDNTLEQVVYDGVRFLQSLTAHYGAEKGLEVWEAIGNAVGKEVKGRVFFAMMTGETTSGRVRFSVDTPGYAPDAMKCITAIRTYTGLGLREAKDKFDESKNKTVHVDCATHEAGRRLAQDLAAFGCIAY